LVYFKTSHAPCKQLLSITVMFGVIERTKPVKVNHGWALDADFVEVMERSR